MPSSEHALATAKWFSPLGPAYLGRTWFPLPPAQLEADVRGPGQGGPTSRVQSGDGGVQMAAGEEGA